MNFSLSWAQEFKKGFPKTHVAQRVQDGVNSRVEPQEPKRSFVECMGDALSMASCSYDHQERVGRPAQSKDADNDGQGLGNPFIPGKSKPARHRVGNLRSSRGAGKALEGFVETIPGRLGLNIHL